MDPAYRMSASQLLENSWITVRPLELHSWTSHKSHEVLLQGALSQQGDTNVPVVPSNVLEMMRQYLEQEESNDKDYVS